MALTPYVVKIMFHAANREPHTAPFTRGVQRAATRGVPKVLQGGLSDKMICAISVHHMPRGGLRYRAYFVRLRGVFILESDVRIHNTEG